jgi:hypothetical protein
MCSKYCVVFTSYFSLERSMGQTIKYMVPYENPRNSMLHGGLAWLLRLLGYGGVLDLIVPPSGDI